MPAPEPAAPAAASPLAVVREGSGDEVLLVHGGASPRSTWPALGALSEDRTVCVVHRRGFPPSPPAPDGRQDYARDAADLGPLLEPRPHLVAHSYGALGALIAAARRPDRVRSLTLVEPPLYRVAPGDAEVARLERMDRVVLTEGLGSDVGTLRAFLRVMGFAGVDADPLPAAAAAGVRRAQGSRLPGDARPSLEALRDAGVPTLVVSGGHAAALERICDALARRLDARRLVLPGAGHRVPAAPGFADRLREFLAEAG